MNGPLWPKIPQFHDSFFFVKFGKIVFWHPLGSAPPPAGNPGSAPALTLPEKRQTTQNIQQSKTGQIVYFKSYLIKQYYN